MTVSEPLEVLQRVPGHIPVLVEQIPADGRCCDAEDFPSAIGVELENFRGWGRALIIHCSESGL